MNKFILILSLICGFMLTSCGQTGHLYLPQQPKNHDTTQTSGHS